MNPVGNINWEPPVDTSISQPDEYLSERIETIAESPTEAHAPGVYVLEFSTPKTDKENRRSQIKKLWLSEKETLPSYFEELVEAHKLLYVGFSKDVYSRIEQHINKHQTTTLADVFPLHSVFDIYFYETKQKAALNEESHTIDLNNAYPNAYVHSR
jgi:predicted GIY-YIG superfamily endonuclease